MQIKEIFNRIAFKIRGGVVSLSPSGTPKGYVLISYFAYPFLTDKALTGHTNYWEARQMAKEFLDRGYAVDVIDTTNKSFVPKKKYAICIDTHSNLERLAPLLGDTCIKVLHTTTTHWCTQNEAAQKRSADLLARRGASLAPERQLPPSNALEVADIVLMLGNSITQQSYAYAHKQIVPISVSAVKTFASPESKDFERARNSFIWLGGAGAIHKGADLVLEAFASLPDLTLSMCGKYLYPEFEAIYKKELHETPNIKSLGYVQLEGGQFEQIRSSSAFLVFPSCAEGQAGSVVAALHAGLIPIVTKECGVDVDDFGFVLKDASVEEIKNTVQMAAALPVEELRRRATLGWKYANTHHTRKTFAARFSEFVDMLETKIK
ncbi:glycosyltransferase [Patescibacteria group bacterium]|nr:glycosyltransferase [Patescibacteria group bacterium]